MHIKNIADDIKNIKGYKVNTKVINRSQSHIGSNRLIHETLIQCHIQLPYGLIRNLPNPLIYLFSTRSLLIFVFQHFLYQIHQLKRIFLS